MKIHGQHTIIFIGPVWLKGHSERGGDTMKNKVIVDRLRTLFDKVIVVDTYLWKKHPWVIFRLIYWSLAYYKIDIVVSANSLSANKIIRFLYWCSSRRRVSYFVIGGSFANMLENGIFSSRHYKFLNGIFVEGWKMKSALEILGLKNVTRIPNFKPINHLGHKNETNSDDSIIHFVFLSRIEECKGVSDIFLCMDMLNQDGYRNRYDVTFYGSLSADASYRTEFDNLVHTHQNAAYNGLLDLRKPENYDLLANYDVMLFPTFWSGEGFPGIVIDAYIAGLPIIASEWNLNSEIISDGETGWLIPPCNPAALRDRMKWVIEHPIEVSQMSANCHRMASEYDSRNVLSLERLRILGILH